MTVPELTTEQRLAARLRKELIHFFCLPNWENRGPEWQDIKDGLMRVYLAFNDAEAYATGVRPKEQP